MFNAAGDCRNASSLCETRKHSGCWSQKPLCSRFSAAIDAAYAPEQLPGATASPFRGRHILRSFYQGGHPTGGAISFSSSCGSNSRFPLHAAAAGNTSCLPPLFVLRPAEPSPQPAVHIPGVLGREREGDGPVVAPGAIDAGDQLHRPAAVLERDERSAAGEDRFEKI